MEEKKGGMYEVKFRFRQKMTLKLCVRTTKKTRRGKSMRAYVTTD